jgi:6-phosphogluconolactonase/glucosamine-6-phosphate isomerase/deaminase
MLVPPRVIVAEDAEALLPLVRAEIEGAVAPGHRIAVPTGRTPLPLYRAVCADPAARALWGALRYLQLDEYIDPPPGVDTFAATLARELFDPLGVPEEARGRIRDPASRTEAARLDRLLAAEPLRLCLLGLGSNGHVAFNEPGDRARGYHHVELSPASRPPGWPAGARVRALTIGFDQILAADRVILWVPQREKQPLLDCALAGPPDPELPASRLLEHPRLVVFRT